MVIRYAPAKPTQAAARPRGPVVYRGGDVLPASIRVLEVVAAVKARLRRRWVAMALAAAVPLLAAGAYAALQAPHYRATAAVFVDPQVGRPGRADGAVDAATLNGQIRLATSRAVLQKAIDQGKLSQEAALRAPDGLLDSLFRLGLKLVGLETGARNGAGVTVQSLALAAQARQGEGVNLIDIVGSSADAATAARVANAVAQAFVDEVVTGADAASGSERSRLARRGDDLKVRVQEAEARLAQFRARNGFDASRGAGETDAASELARSRLAASEARTRYEQMQKLMASGKEPEAIADLVRTPSLERLKVQYNDAAAQEISFRSSLGPRHPAYLEVQQQAREKKRLLQEGLRLALAAARIEWQTAREQEMAAEKRGGAEPAAPVQPAPTPIPTQLRELERDVEIARAAYDRFQRSVDMPDPAAQPAAARIVAAAAVPLSPESQGRGKLIAGTLGLSLLCAAFAASHPGTGRPSPAPAPDQPPRALRRTVLAARSPAASASPAPAPPPFAQDSGPAPPPAPVVLAGVESLAHELAAASGEFVLQTVLCTALSPDDGKSEAAMALARAAMTRQMRVLVIDADDGENSLSQRYAGAPVAGTVPIQGRPRPLLVAEGGPHRICLIPLESRAPTPPGLASLPALGGIAGNFDLVVINGPLFQGGLLERKLARAAQAVMIACQGAAMPALGRISMLLGVSAEVLRVVQPHSVSATPDAAAPAPGRPLGVVRLRKVA